MLFIGALLAVVAAVGLVAESLPIRALCGSVFILLGILLDLFSLYNLARCRGSCDLITPALFFAVGLYIMSHFLSSYHLVLSSALAAFIHASCQIFLPHLAWYFWNVPGLPTDLRKRDSIDISVIHENEDPP
jgi:hypothetical protein